MQQGEANGSKGRHKAKVATSLEFRSAETESGNMQQTAAKGG